MIPQMTATASQLSSLLAPKRESSLISQTIIPLPSFPGTVSDQNESCSEKTVSEITALGPASSHLSACLASSCSYFCISAGSYPLSWGLLGWFETRFLCWKEVARSGGAGGKVRYLRNPRGLQPKPGFFPSRLGGYLPLSVPHQ